MKNLKNYNEFLNENIFDGTSSSEKFKSVTPEIYVVKIDETQYWREDIQEKAGKIYGIYLVDKSVETHLAELKASWYLYWLYNEVEIADKFEDEDELFEIENQGNSDEDNKYVHVGSTFEAEHKANIDEKDLLEAMDGEEEYNEFIERQIDYFKGNHVI